jgi:DNA-directed RNA polymerase subunit RPC12/RpoP
MSELQALHGLNCPRCGGMVPIPEGQLIVRCPYCDLRSFVRGERGLQRFQMPQRIGREQATKVLKQFLGGNWAIARDAGKTAKLEETFLVHLPFWAVWGRVAAWAFGEKKVGSGKDTRYEPREVRLVNEMTWNGAACDVGEFGVTQVALDGAVLEAYDVDGLHERGLVFEPVGSLQQAKKAAEDQFQAEIRKRLRLDRISQTFVRMFRRRYGLVYYPMWVLRYLYKGRHFQVVVDGFSSRVLYGKAPGNTLFRAAVLVLGMALGAFLAVDASAFAFSLTSGDEGGFLALGVFLIIAGLGVMFVSYRKFRYGEEYEYRASKPKFLGAIDNPLEIFSEGLSSLNVKELEKWTDRLS